MMSAMQAMKFRRRIRFWLGAWLLLFVIFCITSWSGLVRWSVPSLPPNFYPESRVFLRVKDSDTYVYSAVVNLAPDGAPDTSYSMDSDTKDAKPLDASHIAGKDRAHEDESYRYIVDKLGLDLEIVITGLDRSRSWANSFACCIATDSGEEESHHQVSPSFTSTAGTYFEHVKQLSWGRWIKEYWLSYPSSVYVATQYSCKIPRRYLSSSSKKPAFITLAPMPSFAARTLSPFVFFSWPRWWWSYASYCPRDRSDYLPVEYPRHAPSELGLCSKVNHNGGGVGGAGPEPDVVLEWFELQRHLGVDRIVVYDMGDNSAEMNSVLMHYQNAGVLDLVPYDLPGEPRGRHLGESLKRSEQFGHDETMAVLECRLRLSGHGAVLSLDKDEVLVPRKDVSLKELLQTQFSAHPEAASLVFPTQFFITTWPASDPEEELLVLRYRQTRLVRWECWKYAFIPARVKAIVTHEAFPKQGFSSVRIPDSKAILHHYRTCPKDTWGTCQVGTTIDNTMTRYKDGLTSRVNNAKAAIKAMRKTMDKEEEEGEEDR